MSPASRVISSIGSLISSCLKFPETQLRSVNYLFIQIVYLENTQSISDSIIACLPLENLGKISFSFLQNNVQMEV